MIAGVTENGPVEVLSDRQWSWRYGCCCSRTGAAHRRRGMVCQDSAALATACSADGQPVAVVALADGHGHRRHFFSAEGGRQACRVAVEVVMAMLQSTNLTPLARPVDWQATFAGEVADQIHAAWVAAIRRHWLQDIQRREVPFTPLPYGCTLGYLVLTPQWWAVTGLGDWDLVLVGSDGAVELLSEEISVDPALETTASLCHDEAASAFAPRTRVELIDRAGAPFALLLSTDGVRKSCGATADFLAWCRDLVGDLLIPRVEQGVSSLGERLDRLSRWGTGDDVSVAIAIHGDLLLPRPIETEWSPQRLPRRQAACVRGAARRGVRRSLATAPWMLLWRRPALVLAMIVAMALPGLGFVLTTLGGWCTVPWRSGPCGAFRR